MSRKKNHDLCWDCQFRRIDYTTSVTGAKLAHGICRECFERKASRKGGSGGGRIQRSAEKQENINETKYGIDR